MSSSAKARGQVTRLRNSAAGRHLFLTARRCQGQIVGADVNPNGHEHGDQANPKAPVMVGAPPVRNLPIPMMAVVTLAIGMRVFGIVHGHC